MKTLISMIIVCCSLTVSAQISFAGKAHLLFPTGSPTWKNISTTATTAYEQKGKNNTGFNVGLSMRVATPTSFFIMPELYYTSFTNEVTDIETNTTLKAKNNRIDLPVLLGYNLLGETLGVFVGPVASYNINSEESINNFFENAKNNFTVGYQFGAQASISSLIVSARYEGAFSKDERSFINNNVNGGKYEVRYDNRPSFFMIGLGYKF